MTNDDQPAASSGGPRNASETDPRGADLPHRLRVHALAKMLGLTSKDVLAALAEVGSPVKGAQSSIERDTALRVAAALLPDPVEPDGESVGEITEEIDDGRLVTPLAPVFAAPQPLFLAPERTREQPQPVDEDDTDLDEAADIDDGAAGRRRRRRGRRGRGRGKAGQNGDTEDPDNATDDIDDVDAVDTAEAEDAESTDVDAYDGEDADAEDTADDTTEGTRRRRRRRRRKTADSDAVEAVSDDDPPNTVVHVREARPSRVADSDDGVQGFKGSTRLEAKRQRRRDGREAGRRRAPILSEAEFLARRESVDRIMIVREHGRSGNGATDQGLVQIGVLEDGVLVEHFVTSAGAGSLVGNVYLGRVQNVLPSMEAAFVDIGRGRNAVLYAGEVDWDAAGLEGKARKIEQALSTGDSVLVQVTKDPVGHKGARLTTQISLPGRFLVYVPGGGATGISRKLPDTERKRLKDILRRIVPEDAGVIIRTASEGVTEESLGRDVRRLQAQWEVIRSRSEAPNAQAPQLLYEEPDLLIKVVRDLFTEDFSTLVVQGRDAMDTITAYVEHVAPDLAPRLRKHVGVTDVFTEYRVDEQIIKALDRKVWLPSGGYLVIDRTEAMTVIDVNTGKFTGAGGNLEETVTRNNLEAAEEIVRQLRLRDIGGIIVIDFIDMVLESNRDLVLRRLTECLGRDRTRHQVAEVTSLGLVQMTRKRVGSGLLEAFSTPCEHCRGRGVLVSTEPVELKAASGGDSHGEGSVVRRPRSRSASVPSVEPAAPAAQSPPTAETAEPPMVLEPAGAETPAEVAPAAVGPTEVTDAEPPQPSWQFGQAPTPADQDESPAADGSSSQPTAGRPATDAAEHGRDDRAVDEQEPSPPDVEPAELLGDQAVIDQTATAATATRPRQRRVASRPAGPPAHGDVSQAG
jgi:ribonuclease E